MSFARNYTTERLTIDVLPEMQSAVRAAAARRQLSAAAYLRRAVTSALAFDGFSVPVATSDEPHTVVALRSGASPSDMPVRTCLRTGEQEFR